MPQINIPIRFQPKQSKLWFLLDRSKFTRVGGGGARGGAKSGGGRRIMLVRRFNYPNTTGLILRRTYPELYKSHIVKLFAEYPELQQFWREQQKELKLPNGSRLFFGSAPHPGDMADYYSAEFDDIMLDEAQEFSQQEIERLSGSCRTTTQTTLSPSMLFFFMPGVSESGLPPIGLDYLKRVFVDNNQRGEETRQKWAFVQMFAWDNVEWARKELDHDGVTDHQFYKWPEQQRRQYFLDRTEFGATLSALTNKALREAWLEGKWGVFQGQYFPQFNYDRHTAERGMGKEANSYFTYVNGAKMESFRCNTWNKKWLSGDWGYDHPACYLWHEQDESGRVLTYRELWGREMNEETQGQQIALLSGDDKLREFWLSWDAFGKLNKTTRKSVVDMIAEALPKRFPRPQPADSSPGSRISGWRLMSKLLDSGMWVISRDCEKLIQCLPSLMRDMERNTEDVLKVDWGPEQLGDDAADAARYGLQNALDATAIPVEEQNERQIQTWVSEGKLSTSNPTAIMMWRKTLELRAQQKQRGQRFAYHALHGGRDSGANRIVTGI